MCVCVWGGEHKLGQLKWDDTPQMPCDVYCVPWNCDPNKPSLLTRIVFVKYFAKAMSQLTAILVLK